MKDKFIDKYVSFSYYSRLLGQCHQFYQGNQFVGAYEDKFDILSNRYGDLGYESNIQILSRFINGL